jgi:REP element-mobilizing transposase RayT
VPDSTLRTRKRKLPHWTLSGSTYYVTFTLREGKLTLQERDLVLRHIRFGDGKQYCLVGAVVMEDHAHVILMPNDGVSLGSITKGMKGVSARKINEERRSSGALWLAESFDRIIRNEKEFHEKLNYMLNNAPKKGLVDDGWEYTWWYLSERVAL